MMIEDKNVVTVIVSDVVDVTLKTLNAAKEIAGLDDMADDEVFYAYCANYMVHVMESADVRRASLNTGEYKGLSDPAAIDKADIAQLKKFVNRVYGVYEQDMMGQSSYATLAAGWHYVESGKKMEDWQADKRASQKRIMEKTCMWLWNTPAQAFVGSVMMLYDVVALYGGANQSEYLKALNKTQEKVAEEGSWNGYTFSPNFDAGILPVDRAESIYGEIGRTADKVELPAMFLELP